MSTVSYRFSMDSGIPAAADGSADPTRPAVPYHPGSGLPVAGAVLTLAGSVGLADDATLTVLADGSPTVLDTAGSGVGAAADELQLRHGEGPCLTSSRTGNVTVVQDLATEIRWPGWTAAARTLGIAAVLSVPLPGPHPVGALNLWQLSTRTFTDADTARARHLAALAADLLCAHVRHQNFDRAIQGRTLIGQAQGILVERYRITPAAAFTALRTYSQHHNRKLSSLADELVHTGQLPHLHGPDPVSS